MKNYFLLIILLSLFLTSTAQVEDKLDVVQPKLLKKTIAVVPFMPHMYNNDLARLWYKTGESDSQDQQIYDVSHALALTLADSLIGSYDLIDLNVSQTISSTDFLLEYYQLCSFVFADTVPQKERKLKWAKDKLKKKKEVKKDKDFHHKELHSEKRDRTYQFLNVNIRDIRKYKKLCVELGVDQVLFINQFDVKGDYSSPYNSGRETDYFINIHYSLYDKNAKLILGNKTKFSTTNEKARYRYFLEHDLAQANIEIYKKIAELNRLMEEARIKAEKKKKQ